MAELVDAADSKSVSGDRVGVRFSLEAPSAVCRWLQGSTDNQNQPLRWFFYARFRAIPVRPIQGATGAIAHQAE